MKIPYLNKRIELEFSIFLTELEVSVQQSVTNAMGTMSKDLFASVYPLFVLLRILSNSSHIRDPSRDTVLTELRSASKKNDFLKALGFFRKGNVYTETLANGLQRQVFTGYFQELFSDTLLLLNSFYTNNYRGTYIALRCMLEDLYRHLYYRDHPQEYWALGEEGKCDEISIGVRPHILREYLKRTNYLNIFSTLNSDFINKTDTKEETLFSVNDTLYSKCSAAMHGSGDISHNSFQSNLDFVKSEARANEVIAAAKQFSDLAVAFLVSAHIDQFVAFNEYERSLVLSKFSDSRRAALRKALNV